MKPGSKKVWKVLAYAVAIILALYLLIADGVSRYYKNRIRERLPALAAKATDSLYHITIQDLRINILNGAVTVYGLKMTVDSSVLERRRSEGRPEAVVLDVLVKEAKVAGVKWNNLNQEKALSCRAVTFYKPVIRVQIMPEWERKKERKPAATPLLSMVSAKRINIEEPEVVVLYGFGEEAYSVHNTGGRIHANNWIYHPGQALDSNTFFGAKNADILLRDIQYEYPDAMYEIGLDGIEFHSGGATSSLLGLQVNPKMDHDAFYQKIGHRSDIYECKVAEIGLKGFDWKKLLRQHEFYSEEINVDKLDLSVFFSRIPKPVENERKPYPHQRLQHIGLPFTVRNIHVSDASISYAEQNNKTGETGTIRFDYLHGNISNLTNDSLSIDSFPICRTLIGGKFMHRSDILTLFDFSLKSQKGAFSINTVFKDLEASQLRETINALALADIKSLKVPYARISIAGNEDSTWGKFAIRYNNLNVKLKKWDELDSELHARVFVSLLANKLLLYPDNPMPGGILRKATSSVPRGTTRSFFKMIWKNIYQACAETAIRDEGALDMVKRQSAQKGKPRKRFFKDLFPKRKKSRRKSD